MVAESLRPESHERNASIGEPRRSSLQMSPEPNDGSRPDRQPGKWADCHLSPELKCKACKETKPRAAFGAPTDPRRLVDTKCIDCRSRCRPHVLGRTTCRLCGASINSKQRAVGLCGSCNAEKKREARKNAAELAGKPYTPGVPFWAVSAAARRGRPARQSYWREPGQFAERTWRNLEKMNARQAWEYWIARAPQWWLAVHESARPWSGSMTQTERFRLRYRHDPDFNVMQRLRTAARKGKMGRIGEMLRAALKRGHPATRLCDFLDYSIADLRRHLERQFLKRMTWEKFCAGEIHIDHIVPLSLFDLDDPDEVRRAWALTNLRPLWEKQNVAKGARRETLL